MLHYMISHEPFLFNADGTLHPLASFTKPDAYISSIEFTNTVVNGIVNEIRSGFNGKDYVIVVQSDHGFKFDEKDPFFESESCEIFYAVYASDKTIAACTDDISSVNGCRLIFNKYFNSGFLLLPSCSYTLTSPE